MIGDSRLVAYSYHLSKPLTGQQTFGQRWDTHGGGGILYRRWYSATVSTKLVLVDACAEKVLCLSLALEMSMSMGCPDVILACRNAANNPPQSKSMNNSRITICGGLGNCLMSSSEADQAHRNAIAAANMKAYVVMASEEFMNGYGCRPSYKIASDDRYSATNPASIERVRTP